MKFPDMRGIMPMEQALTMGALEKELGQVDSYQNKMQSQRDSRGLIQEIANSALLFASLLIKIIVIVQNI